MPYATLQQLTDRYGTAMLVDLTDRAVVATGVIDTSVVDRALADADELINGYLFKRYTLPLATVPGLITVIAAGIAIWALHIGTPNEKITEDYKAAMRNLDNIAKGTVGIPAAGVEPSSSGSTGARITDRERPLTAENLTGFI